MSLGACCFCAQLLYMQLLLLLLLLLLPRAAIRREPESGKARHGRVKQRRGSKVKVG